MATASTSGQSGFGRKKKNPGLMDQISKFFGGEKKKRSKGSFRGHHATSPQQSSARRRTNENAVVHFFRSLVSSPPPKSTWREALGLSHSLLLDDFEIARLFMKRRPRRVLRARSRRSGGGENKARCPDSSTWETPSPAHLLNAGAPSSRLSAEDQTSNRNSDPTGPEGERGGDTDLPPPPPEELTH
uniref:Myelin basic protein n=1 Tax=Nothobranchius furzeri TaxID=105023 RepID=A0A8C6M7J2_NOTFU